ncbi:MAG: response regulator transcription factor [Flavobacteriales bacterium]|nr:response regulator transcription factor [Flavobacteriales bacterium]
MKQIVIIEDDDSIAELVELHLSDMGCTVHRFADGRAGYEYAKTHVFDLLVLDINLPNLNGLDICRKLREEKIYSPVLMLTARTDEIDKVLGLETGADDYVTKPFSIREFLARVKAILRRVENDMEVLDADLQIIRIRDMEIDRKKRRVVLNSKRIELTPKEFDLLFLLASNPGVTYERKELLNKVWGYNFKGFEHTVNSHINRLRTKIEIDPNEPTYVLTTWGVGYRFSE